VHAPSKTKLPHKVKHCEFFRVSEGEYPSAGNSVNSAIVFQFTAPRRPHYNPPARNVKGFCHNAKEALMAVTIKKIVLWRKEVENRAGMLANALAPLAHAGTNIHVVMAYRFPGQDAKAAIELYPVTGRKSTNAAKEVGFNASSIPALLVEGDDRAGIGYETAQAIADAGISMDFLVAQVIGRKYSAVFGFASDADATRCAAIIRKTAAKKKR
jgi:hypothetical protein